MVKPFPFDTVCPFCGRAVDGLVDPRLLPGGGGPFAEKVSGLVAVRCASCGNALGVRLRFVENKAVVVNCDLYAKLLAEDFEAIRASDKTSRA